MADARRTRTLGTALVALALLARPAAATNHLIVIDEVLGSWQGDDRVQFVELRLLAAGQGDLVRGGGTYLVIDDATGSEAGRRVFRFERDLTNAAQGARVLIGTPALRDLASIEPDFVLDEGWLRPRAGRVCYFVNPPQDPGQTTGIIDCVAYGKYEGDTGRFGPPTPVTPDNRSLQRWALTGLTQDDWTGALEPTPENNAGEGVRLQTLCGDGVIHQGEQCDGEALGGHCASLGSRAGDVCASATTTPASAPPAATTPSTATSATASTRRAALCEPRLRADAALHGALQAHDARLRSDLLRAPAAARAGMPGRWLVTNAAGRPGADGRAPVRQRCTDGDAGCDADATAGTCTFTVALCFDREDARFARGDLPCRTARIERWTLLRPPPDAGDPTGLVAAAAALGPSTTADGSVSFAPPIGPAENCTAPLAIAVPTRGTRPGKLVLRARTEGAGGKPRDVDALRLTCLP
jgi:hypothetical protein